MKSANLILSAKKYYGIWRKKPWKRKKIQGNISADLRVIFHEPFIQNDVTCWFPKFTIFSIILKFYRFLILRPPLFKLLFRFWRIPFHKRPGLQHLTPKEKLLWDNALEIRDVFKFDLSPKICAVIQGDKLLMAYNSSGKIGSKIIKGPETTGKLEFSPLESKLPGWQTHFGNQERTGEMVR